jgi:hypothetical protein
MALHGCKPYSLVYMKKKLIEHFGEDTQCHSQEGINDLFSLNMNTFHNSIILCKYERNSDPYRVGKISIISVGVKLIRDDIRNMTTSTDTYDVEFNIINFRRNSSVCACITKNIIINTEHQCNL